MRNRVEGPFLEIDLRNNRDKQTTLTSHKNIQIFSK